MATVESSAFFLRDTLSGKEIIIFGDVEPDSVALEPHNLRVWRTAAPKIVSGVLRAIFIECSYNDSVDDAYLYGHLCPRHLVAELKVLAKLVMETRTNQYNEITSTSNNSKRKWDNAPSAEPMPISPRSVKRTRSTGSKADMRLTASETSDADEDDAEFSAPNSSRWADAYPLPLAELSVYIIHIKESLTDGPPPGHQILRELQEQAAESRLGCQFFLPDPEEGIFIG